MNPVQAILFDLRNTLLKPRRATGLFCVAARRQGVTVTFAEMNRLIHEVSREVFLPEEEFHQYLAARGWKVEPYEADERWLLYFRTVLERAGLGAKVEPAAQELQAIYQSAERWELHRDVPYALGRLRAEGYRLAVVSNWTPRLDEVLGALGLAPFFEVAVASEVVGYCKPHPRLFQAALERLHLEPEAALHVGDDLHFDVLGARNAGIAPVLLDRYDHHPLESSVPRIRSLGPLLELLRGPRRSAA